mmetsp:Transcript_27217/g.73308  ORF Transcript_27217/g.73308 Transcript_27217/m.73308 type:complete len:205 (+) Transcript_27217:759-1373(+)
MGPQSNRATKAKDEHAAQREACGLASCALDERFRHEALAHSVRDADYAHEGRVVVGLPVEAALQGGGPHNLEDVECQACKEPHGDDEACATRLHDGETEETADGRDKPPAAAGARGRGDGREALGGREEQQEHAAERCCRQGEGEGALVGGGEGRGEEGPDHEARAHGHAQVAHGRRTLDVREARVVGVVGEECLEHTPRVVEE